MTRMKATTLALLFCTIAGIATAAPRLPTFMAGAWIAHSDDKITEEHWTDSTGGMMLGMGRTVDADGKITFEYLRIAPYESTIAYYAMPQGRPATAFPLKSINPSRVVFENRAHDYPQRITYWRDGQNLCARIEGTIGGKASSEEWCWGALRY